jgi:hypothetical protein
MVTNLTPSRSSFSGPNLTGKIKNSPIFRFEKRSFLVWGKIGLRYQTRSEKLNNPELRSGNLLQENVLYPLIHFFSSSVDSFNKEMVWALV